jgi:hypothetical protein
MLWPVEYLGKGGRVLAWGSVRVKIDRDTLHELATGPVFWMQQKARGPGY